MAGRGLSGAHERAHHDRRPGGELAGQIGRGRERPVHEGWIEEEIAGRVAGHGELREDDKLGAAPGAFPRGSGQAPEIALEVSDPRIDLRQRDFQGRSPISPATASRRFSAASTESRRRQTSSPRRNVR